MLKLHISCLGLLLLARGSIQLTLLNLQIRDMAFVFEVNSKSVRRHLENVTENHKENNLKCEWPEQGINRRETDIKFEWSEGVP